MAGIGIEDEVAFAEPADLRGEGEACDLGKTGGFEQAHVVFIERGEEQAIA